MATIATKPSGYVLAQDPFIKTAKESDQDQVIASIVLAFSSDPAVRWMYPDPTSSFQASQTLCALSAEKRSNMGRRTILTASLVRLFGSPQISSLTKTRSVHCCCVLFQRGCKKKCLLYSSRWGATTRQNPTGTCRSLAWPPLIKEKDMAQPCLGTRLQPAIATSRLLIWNLAAPKISPSMNVTGSNCWARFRSGHHRPFSRCHAIHDK